MIKSNWVLDPGKFLSREEVNRLLETARKRAQTALARGNKVAVRDYFVVNLALSTGLRVAEIADLKCKDVFLRECFSALLVRNGKGGKKRLVRFNGSFKRHYEEYILWKQVFGEPVGLGDPLLLSSNTSGHMTTRALEKAFKRTVAFRNRFAFYCTRCCDKPVTADIPAGQYVSQNAETSGESWLVFTVTSDITYWLR